MREKNNNKEDLLLGLFPYTIESIDEPKKENTERGRVTVRMELENGCYRVSDSVQPNKFYIRPFRGIQSNGLPEEIFNKYCEEETKDIIFYEYIDAHRQLTEDEKEILFNRINKNIDINVYKVLQQYDTSNYWKTNKSKQYLEAMLKPIKRKSNQTDKKFKVKEHTARLRALRMAGIDIEYDLSGIVFSRNNILDNIKAIRQSNSKGKFAAKINLFGKRIENSETTIKRTKETQKHMIYKNAKSSKTKSSQRNKTQEKKKVVQSRTTTNKSKMAQQSRKGKTIEKAKTIQITKPVKETKKAQKTVSHQFNDRIKKFKTSKVFTAPKGMLNNLREKVKEKDFGKKVKRILVTAGIIGMVGLSTAGIGKIGMSNNHVAQISAPNATSSSETIANENTYQESNKINIDEGTVEFYSNTENESKLEKPSISETESKTEKEENKINNIKEQNSNDYLQEDGGVVLQDAIIDTLGIGIGTHFSMTSGKYYETPNQTGNSGNYQTYGGNVKINYIAAMGEDGYYQYSVKDGLTISQIKEKHPNDEISYHVLNDNGMTLGWNSSKENDIETNMTKAYIMSLKQYLSTETIKFLCDVDLSSSISKEKCQKYFDDLQSAKSQLEKQTELAEIER